MRKIGPAVVALGGLTCGGGEGGVGGDCRDLCEQLVDCFGGGGSGAAGEPASPRRHGDVGTQGEIDACAEDCTESFDGASDAEQGCFEDQVAACGDESCSDLEDCGQESFANSETCREFEEEVEQALEDWTCPGGYFGTNDGCDCGCGSSDLDCPSGDCLDPGCTADACDYCWTATGENLCPGNSGGGWICPGEFYGTGDGCDCGCGADDPDCGGATPCTAPGCTDSGCDFCWTASGDNLC